MKNNSRNFKTIPSVIIAALLLIITSVGFYACKKTQSSDQALKEQALKNPVIKKFINSPEFVKNISTFNSFGKIDFGRISIDSIVHLNKTYHILYIPIYSKDKIVAGVQVVDLLNTKNLPNNETYAINFVNLRGFDEKTLTGTVKMIDLNYDKFEHSTIAIENNKIKKWSGNGLSSLLKSKYSNISMRFADGVRLSSDRQASVKIDAKISAAKGVLCDLNGNGNLSFTECYKCFSDAIDSDGFSSWVCDIPVAGWASCWGSTTAACVILSATY